MWQMSYRSLSDPNAEYTMRDRSGETMGLSQEDPPRDVEISDVQTLFDER